MDVGAAGGCEGVDVAFEVRSVGQSSAANQARVEVIKPRPFTTTNLVYPLYQHHAQRSLVHRQDEILLA